MALNLADRIAVRANIVDRCTAAVANYSLYILGNVAAAGMDVAARLVVWCQLEGGSCN